MAGLSKLVRSKGRGQTNWYHPLKVSRLRGLLGSKKPNSKNKLTEATTGALPFRVMHSSSFCFIFRTTNSTKFQLTSTNLVADFKGADIKPLKYSHKK